MTKHFTRDNTDGFYSAGTLTELNKLADTALGLVEMPKPDDRNPQDADLYKAVLERVLWDFDNRPQRWG